MVNSADVIQAPDLAVRSADRPGTCRPEAIFGSLIGPHPRTFYETTPVEVMRPETDALDRHAEAIPDAVGPNSPLWTRRPAVGAKALLDDAGLPENGRFATVSIPRAIHRLTARAVPHEEPQRARPGGVELTSGDLEAVQAGLQALSAAMVLLDASGRLVFANQEAQALLAQADGIRLDRSNVVRCMDSAAQKQLCQSLEPCRADRRLAGPGDSGNAGTKTFAIRRDIGLPLVALVISQSAGAPGTAAGHRRTVLLLRDPERELRVATELLPALFGLSAAEAAVAARLAAGASLEQIAEERDVRLITVRNQLKSALGKFGVRRQAELVSIVLRAIQF